MLIMHACKLLCSTFSWPHTVYRLAWLTQPGRVGSKQIPACKFLLLSHPLQPSYQQRKITYLVILHNFADLLAAFIPLDMNITVMFLKASEIQTVHRRHRIFVILSVMPNENVWVWTSWNVFNKSCFLKNFQWVIFSNLLSCSSVQH